MNRFALKESAAGSRAPTRLHRQGFHVFFEAGRETVRRHKMVVRSFLASDRRHVRFAKARPGPDKRIQTGWRTKVGRAIDLSPVGVAVLLLSDLVKSFFPRRSSLRRRAFSIANPPRAAKFCTRAICLSLNGRTSWR